MKRIFLIAVLSFVFSASTCYGQQQSIKTVYALDGSQCVYTFATDENGYQTQESRIEEEDCRQRISQLNREYAQRQQIIRDTSGGYDY